MNLSGPSCDFLWLLFFEVPARFKDKKKKSQSDLFNRFGAFVFRDRF